MKRRLERTRVEIGKFALKSRDCAKGQERIEERAGPWDMTWRMTRASKVPPE